MPDIFLSYNREDQATARRFADAFAGQGFNVWWDVGLTSGEAYDQVTEKALREAKAVVVLWSKHSVESRWCRAEATLADRNKTLVPCMVEPCERPIMFELVQTAELSYWQGAPDDRAWIGFLADVRRFIEKGSPVPVGAQAPASLVEIAKAPDKPAETLLAVLPFDNLSADAEMAFFSDGVSEDIVGRLSRGSKLKVIGKTSSFQFRGPDKPKAAAALKATHVLDGSIRRAGGKVRIAAHLTEIANHTTLWADKYDRGLEDVFAVQDEISEAIAEALNTTFFPAKATKIDAAAYDLYLRAKDWAVAEADIRKSIALLENVTRLAPEFADAWGQLANHRAHLRMQLPYAERLAITALTEEAIAKCLALDPENKTAWWAKERLLDPFGQFLTQEANVFRAASHGHGPAHALRPDWHLTTVGRLREAVGHSRQAYDLDPLNELYAISHGRNLWWAGRFADARAVLERNRDIWPGNHLNAANLLLLNAYEKNWAGVDEMLHPVRLAQFPLRELSPVRRSVEAMRDGSPDKRSGFLTAVRTRVQSDGHIDPASLLFAAHFGFVDEAFNLLEGARLGPSGSSRDALGPDAYRTNFLFAAAYPELRNDPRFVKLCARLGLVEYWLATQKWPDCADHVPYDLRTECETHRATPKDEFGV